MKQLWLVGMPGVGKSTVGRRVAETAATSFHDTDLLVESVAGATVAEIWESRGESEFRYLESMVIAGLEAVEGVIATGGGAVLFEENRERMLGTVVWLEASSAQLRSRLTGYPTRPILARGGDLDRMALLRRPFYQSVATHQVTTDGRSIDDIVGEVVALWNP